MQEIPFRFNVVTVWVLIEKSDYQSSQLRLW